VTLRGEDGLGRSPRADIVGKVINQIQKGWVDTLRMGFVYSSSAKARLPKGLKKAADVRFLGIDGSGKSETILHFSAPHFIDISPNLYEQQELENLSQLPDADWTVFNLFEHILEDIAEERTESDRFDEPILRDLSGYKRLIHSGGLESIIFDGQGTGPSSQMVNEPIIKIAERLRLHTPGSQRVRICAKLDMLRVSDHLMELEVNSGERFKAVWNKKPIEQPRTLLGSQVLLEGLAVFKPSGNILRVEIDALESATGQDAFFSQLPTPILQESSGEYRRKKEIRPKGETTSIFGKWPGTESDEEIKQLLREWS